MATRTVLSMVQNILSSMDSDEVNSLSDTIESAQVAEVIKEVYEDMVMEYELPSNHTLFQMTAATTAKPTHMTLPSNVVKLEWIKYNNLNAVSDPLNYQEVIYLEPEVFIELVSARTSSDSTVDSISDDSGVTLLITNNANPSYWTSFDDVTIILDSYDSGLETNLQNSKTNCYGIIENTLTLTDVTVPNLPPQLFPLLLTESKSRCYAYFKQTINAKVEQRSRRQRIMQQKRKSRTNDSIKTIDYGRK